MASNAEHGDLIVQLAGAVGTPFWVYDAARVEAQIARLRGFDVIRYAQKANSNLELLRVMRRNGVLVDAVSLGEIERAQAAGYRAGPGAEDAEHDEIVFTADIIDRPTLAKVVELNIPVNCGSPDMVDQIAAASPGHRIWHEDLPDLASRIRASGLDLVGLHMHIGSGVDYEHLERVGDAMVDAYRALGLPIRAISAGGGLSVPYRDGAQEIDADHYTGTWEAARRTIQQSQGAPVSLEIEPGRFLTAAAGSLVAEIRAVKRVADRHFVIVDAGFNDLARPAMYGSYHRIAFLRADGTPVTGQTADVAVAGPLCESGDVFTQGEAGVVQFRSMPLPAVGDLCVFADAGAYGAAMSSNYNSRPLIPEVVVDRGVARLARRRQTMADLLALEEGADLALDLPVRRPNSAAG
jgi:diaminopimelate decarboxylase